MGKLLLLIALVLLMCGCAKHDEAIRAARQRLAEARETPREQTQRWQWSTAEPVQQLEPKRIVVYVADWCAACGPLKAEVERMYAAGWSRSQLEVIDVDEQPAPDIEELPAVALYQGDRRVSLEYGHRTSQELRTMWDAVETSYRAITVHTLDTHGQWAAGVDEVLKLFSTDGYRLPFGTLRTHGEVRATIRRDGEQITIRFTDRPPEIVAGLVRSRLLGITLERDRIELDLSGMPNAAIRVR